MDMSIYLLIGLLIGGLLAFRAKPLVLFLACLYWLMLTLWALGVIHPFTFHTVHWLNLFKVNFDYHIDGLSNLFTLLISGIGFVVFIYSWIYTQNMPDKRPKLLALLQLFAVSMLGIVLANDMLMLFLCWELTSIFSYLLIQFDVRDEGANQAAFNSLFITVLGSLVLLVGFILLNNLTGSWSVIYSLKHATFQVNSFKMKLALCFIFCGVITKSAQFPFYFWLTGAMKAPTPVSAYLHSAAMVNAGIYLLARFHPLFSGLSLWYPLLSTFGLITMAVSSLLSLFQEDLKIILAYTTVFALGAMVYLLGGKSPLPIEAFAIFLLFHGVYKAGAFMLVGTIDKEYHTRQLHDLIGVARHRGILALISVITLGAMAGLPPFFGFTVKEMIFEAKLALPTISYFLMGISIISSMLIAAVSFRCLWYFFKKNEKATLIREKLSLGFVCPIFLAILVLLFSVYDKYVEKLIEPTIQAIIPTPQPTYLSPNIKISFILSFITVIGGIAILVLSFLFKKLSLYWPKDLKLRVLFEASLKIFLQFGKFITQYTQGQSVTNQLKILFISIGIFLFVIMFMQFNGLFTYTGYSNFFKNWLVCCFLILSSLSLMASRRFLYNLISLSLVGFASSFFFIVNGAVDVAITQILVEVLTIIILLIALRQVKVTSIKIPKHTRWINSIIALALGFIIAHMLWFLKTFPFNTQLQQFYIKNSFIVAYGKNIVNVILVDFRSLDTFGEAIVIFVTAVGITLLLKKYFSWSRREHVNHP